MLMSWFDLVLGFIVWWAGLYFYRIARLRRLRRRKASERDTASIVVQWLSATLITAGLLVVLASLVLRWVVR